MSELYILLRMGDRGVVLPYQEMLINAFADALPVEVVSAYTGAVEKLIPRDDLVALEIIRRPAGFLVSRGKVEID